MLSSKLLIMTRSRCTEALLQSAATIHSKAAIATPLDDDVIGHVLPGVSAEYQDEEEALVESEVGACAVKPFSDMPGPRGLPLIGNALKYTKLGEEKWTASSASTENNSII